MPRWKKIVLALWLATAALTAPAVRAADDALMMGVFPRRNSMETTRAFAPMADYLGKRLGRKVKLITSKNFDAFWKDVQDQRYDIVHYNPYHYIRSAQHYEVVAHIEEAGKSTIAGVIYVRKDSGITALNQLRGRTVMFGGGEDAMVSYIACQYLLLQAGLKKDDVKPLFAVNPPNALVALAHRQADAAGAGGSVLDLSEVAAAIGPDALTALASSPPLLQLPIAVKRDMAATQRASIQSILVDLKNSDEGRQVLKAAALTGIEKAEDKDYDPHRKMVSAVLDPAAAGSKRTAARREAVGAKK